MESIKSEPLESCQFEIHPGRGFRRVFLTAGAHVDNRGRIFAVFADEDGARSERSLEEVLAIVGEKDLTQDQIAMAERNSERI